MPYREIYIIIVNDYVALLLVNDNNVQWAHCCILRSAAAAE